MDEIIKYEPNFEKFQEYGRKKFFKNQFSELDKITDKWGYFRQMYMEMMPDIMNKANDDISIPLNPYFFDWLTHFSPIEYNAWMSIRSTRIALYPQFPLFNYFIDFANPYLRVGLELDGKDYHDEKKDKLRDEKLSEFGWRIFRVTGKETYTKFKKLTDIESEYEKFQNKDKRYKDLSNWMLNSCDGVVNAIRIVYFENDFPKNSIWKLAMKTLEKHNLVNFQLKD